LESKKKNGQKRLKASIKRRRGGNLTFGQRSIFSATKRGLIIPGRKRGERGKIQMRYEVFRTGEEGKEFSREPMR